MAHLITLIPGDGIGPEVADATVRAVDATGAAIEWERVEAGPPAAPPQGPLIPPAGCAVDPTGAAIEWERVEAGLRALTEQGQLIPDDVFASLEMTRVGLKGPTTTPIGGGHQSINVVLRKKLGLY